MSSIPFTDEQRAAIAATGTSVMVSAAAGSGKTAVLAERCAHLLCDAPPQDRCNADELLVLTFTDAAATEMRNRIVEAIRSRLARKPSDERLREQLALLDAARVTTVSSFCLWLIRRWFSDLGIDPMADVLDQDETRLLKSEVLDALFSDLYDVTKTPDAPFGLGSSESKSDAPDLDGEAQAFEVSQRWSRARLGPAFARLVGDYGLGEDRPIAEFVLSLYEFTMSLPDPDRWLREAHDAVVEASKQTVASLTGHLRVELDLQIEHCEQLAVSLEGDAEIPSYFPGRVREYLEQLDSWKTDLGEAAAETKHADMEARLARFERVRSHMAAFEFARVAGPRLAKDANDDERAHRDATRDTVSDLKKRLFKKRLEVPFALFSVDELLGDLNKTAPYIRTIIQLVTAFRDAYASRKRDLGVLDFADLERYAFDLLAEGGKPDTPSQAALSLHERFRHVLVDEFQDINPIQDAIIRLASRESDPSRPSNLFVVGDVKQSIYRFRLAEPGLFIERLRDGADPATSSVAIRLRTNFRSRPPVIDAVNTVFERLMRKDFGGVAYDDDARLRAGRSVDPADKAGSPADPKVELHVLERKWSDSSNDGDDDEDAIERGPAALSNPARWSPIEREAYLIGLCIRECMATDALETDGRPLGYGDVAVLLRARKVNAERIASILALMGIPAYADASGSLLATREIRDVLAALQLFDNAQQDIPLAAVMRSGILCEPLSVDELLDIRCHDRSVAFHEAVRDYALKGRDAELRGRVRGLLDRLASYRESARRRPLAGVLWELYEKQGYLAYAGGLPGGAQRRANLLELHDLARRFGTFRRQGLRRFLGFVHLLDEGRQELPTAPSVGEADDVVRIMSIHQAKGLEFPVVFVAGLGTKFNLSDRRGRMIFERDAGIGLRVVDTDRMIEYPTVVHSRVTASIDRSTREEEMRVLYVAMTRARDKLVLVGSRNKAEDAYAADRRPGGSDPSRLTVEAAVTPLDWLVPIVSESLHAGPAAPVKPACRAFELHVHSIEEMSGWQQPQHDDGVDNDTRRAAARLAELPAAEPLATDDACVEAVRTRVDYAYPFLSSSSVRAVVAASAFKGTHDFLTDPEARRESSPADDFSVGTSRYAMTGGRDAAQRGILTHRILQHLDFSAAIGAKGLASELHRLTAAGVITQEECERIDSDSIVWFLSTPLAETIRTAGRAYRREFMYLATEPLGILDGSIDAPTGDAVLVRGVVDGIVLHGDGLDILDFKTDAIDPADVSARCERYRPQVALYARAMARIWRRPVKACWLVFLGARKIAAVDVAAANEPDHDA